MKAILASKYGGPDVLQLMEIEKPAPAANEILIRIKATTVSAGDSRMRSFTVPPLFWLPARLTLGFTRPKHPIYGMELAGEIEAVGAQVTKFKPGDRVVASTLNENFGAHAEYRCLPEDVAVAHIPDGVRFEDAATLPISANTALYFLEAAEIRPGQKVLVYGASGGVGTYAVQLARRFGAEVTAVVSSRNTALVESLGADIMIDYTCEDFTQNGVIYDVIFDTVGVTTFAQCQTSLKPAGYYLNTVLVLPEMQAKRAFRSTGMHVVGGTAVPTAESLAFLAGLMANGELKAVIDRCYPLAETASAHSYVDTGRKRGNVVVTME